MDSRFKHVLGEIEKRMPDATFKIQKVEKANVTYTGIVLISNDGICPVFAIPDDITDAEISKFCDGIEYQLAHLEKPDDKCKDIISNWEKAKGKLFVRVMNYINNATWLVENEIPNRVYGDIAIVPYVEVGPYSCTVCNSQLCERWGISPTEILDMALENAQRLKPIHCQTLSGVIHDMAPALSDSKIKIPTFNMPYVITNKEMVYGASAIFYDGILETIADMFDDSFWILPSSTEKVLVMKAPDDDGYELYNMVKSVNGSYVNSDEFLSDNPLFYNRTWKQLYQYNPVTGNLDIA